MSSMNRRELLKLSLLTCGAALTSSAQGSGSPSPLLADDNASASPVLETSLGKLRGAFANGVYSFKGVHYGASTEGARRFQAAAASKAVDWRSRRARTRTTCATVQRSFRHGP